MKVSTFTFIIFCVAFAAADTVGQTNSNADEVLAAVKTYDAAWNSRNVKAAGTLMDENYVYFNSEGGAPTSKSQTLAFLAQPDYKLTFVDRSEIKVFRSGDTAIVSSRWKGKGSWSGGQINDDQRCSLVFTKQKNSWMLLSEHCTQIVPK